MRAFTLFLVTAVATATVLELPESHVVHQLRGADTKVDEGTDRELLSMGGSSSNLSFSFSSAARSDHICFDYYSVCMEEGDILISTETDTQTSGNANALAYAQIELWLAACCEAYAEAQARSCAFTKVDGKVVVNTERKNGRKKVSLNVELNAATTTFAMATSIAVADAYAKIEAKSFTDVATYCTEVNNMSILCAGGTASTDLKQITEARAGATGQASALALTGSEAGSKAAVIAEGRNLSYVYGVIYAYARSWAFASASASAGAFAEAFTEVSNESFAEVCVAKYNEICQTPQNPGLELCSLDATTACATASAKGEAYAAALSIACAEAFINAFSNAEVHVGLSANVDCKGDTPKFTWTCADAGVGQTCGVGV